MRRWVALFVSVLVACAPGPVTDPKDSEDTEVTPDTDALSDTDAPSDTDDTVDTPDSDVPAAPAAPDGLEGRATGTTSAQLLWRDLSADETNFRLERDDGAGFQVLADLSADATLRTELGLTPGATYGYRLRACRDEVCSAPAGPIQITLPTTSTPAAPDDLVVEVFNSSEIDLSWDDNATDETAYVIAWSTNSGVDFEEYPDLPANTQSATDGGLEDGTTYCYRVRAKNAAATSPWSETRCATTWAASVPGSPLDVRSTLLADGRILLTWTNPDTNLGYKVYESVNGGGFGFAGTVTPGNLAGTFIGDLIPSTTYAYRVAATNAYGDSPLSVASNSVTLPAVANPTQLVVRNDSIYPIVSLIVNGTEQLPNAPLGIPPGGTFSVAASAGTSTYTAESGFWAGGSRETLYFWQGSASVTAGLASQVVIDDPSVSQIMTRFAASAAYVGEYWSGTSLGWKRLRFFPNGTYTLENNGVAGGTGTYSLVTYAGNYLATVRLTGAAAGDLLLDERTGSFFLRNGPPGWPTLQYGYEGP